MDDYAEDLEEIEDTLAASYRTFDLDYRQWATQPSLEDVQHLKHLAVPAVEALFVHADFVPQLPAAFLGLQHVVQGRSGLDLSLFITCPLERHDGGLLGGGGIEDQADGAGFNVEFGHGGFLS